MATPSASTPSPRAKVGLLDLPVELVGQICDDVVASTPAHQLASTVLAMRQSCKPLAILTPPGVLSRNVAVCPAPSSVAGLAAVAAQSAASRAEVKGLDIIMSADPATAWDTYHHRRQQPARKTRGPAAPQAEAKADQAPPSSVAGLEQSAGSRAEVKSLDTIMSAEDPATAWTTFHHHRQQPARKSLVTMVEAEAKADQAAEKRASTSADDAELQQDVAFGKFLAGLRRSVVCYHQEANQAGGEERPGHYCSTEGTDGDIPFHRCYPEHLVPTPQEAPAVAGHRAATRALAQSVARFAEDLGRLVEKRHQPPEKTVAARGGGDVGRRRDGPAARGDLAHRPLYGHMMMHGFPIRVQLGARGPQPVCPEPITTAKDKDKDLGPEEQWAATLAKMQRAAGKRSVGERDAAAAATERKLRAIWEARVEGLAHDRAEKERLEAGAAVDADDGSAQQQQHRALVAAVERAWVAFPNATSLTVTDPAIDDPTSGDPACFARWCARTTRHARGAAAATSKGSSSNPDLTFSAADHLAEFHFRFSLFFDAYAAAERRLRREEPDTENGRFRHEARLRQEAPLTLLPWPSQLGSATRASPLATAAELLVARQRAVDPATGKPLNLPPLERLELRLALDVRDGNALRALIWGGGNGGNGGIAGGEEQLEPSSEQARFLADLQAATRGLRDFRLEDGHFRGHEARAGRMPKLVPWRAAAAPPGPADALQGMWLGPLVLAAFVGGCRGGRLDRLEVGCRRKANLGATHLGDVVEAVGDWQGVREVVLARPTEDRGTRDEFFEAGGGEEVGGAGEVRGGL